jgi:EAL domain-containing protein (putative c-di-GMP-specific phosphodiesterase class I)/PAS domain-containing protein
LSAVRVTDLALPLIEHSHTALCNELSQLPYIDGVLNWLGFVPMENPTRVLIVERHGKDRLPSNKMLQDFGLEFTWQSVTSEDDLREVARDFDPTLVLCSDEGAANSLHTTRDMLRLLSARTTEVLVCDVLASCHGDGSSDCAARGLPEGRAVDRAQPAEHIRKLISSAVQTHRDAIVISDSDGRISYANDRACGILPQGADLDDARTRPAAMHMSDMVKSLTARGDGGRTALAFVGVNLNGLSLVNETCGGTLAGDIVDQISSVLRFGETRCGLVAWVGQNEFVVVLPDPSHPVSAAITIRGILESIAQRRHPNDTGDSEIPLHAPDSAIHESPHPWSGESPFEPDHAALMAKHHSQLERELDEAIQRHALSVQYQPQFELQSGRGCGAEVLARWVRSNGESMAPGIFIPAAERSGMIRTLGAWVLKCACETAVTWRGRDSEHLTISVNVSTLQMDEKFYAVLAEILQRSGFPAGRLELEIAESAVLANAMLTIDCLKRWKQLGVRIAVSHFGPDYSSLSYLCRLSVDRLKLDKSITQSMMQGRKQAAMTQAIISLGAELGIDVIAEGVETQSQLKMLTELGCPQAQGYLLARPMADKQAQIALRKTWGNLPNSTSNVTMGALHAS